MQLALPPPEGYHRPRGVMIRERGDLVYTLHVVSHTHWDREWYRTFQEFRFRLVQLVQELLDILESDATYRSFLLDGQTVVLQDVLEVRADLEKNLRQHVRQGRILIGPWFVLPDEFLVSPEALVRNLLLGDAICRAWGAKMELGYVPDPFGHISQLPQLLRGFGIDTAVFWRGVGEAPVEFRWAAPDGSDVLVCYLRDSYGNVALLPNDEEGVARVLARARDSLAPHAATTHLLLMQGTDHMRPRAGLSRLLAAADACLPDRVVHSSLPDYVAAVRAELGERLSSLPLLHGDMRDPSRAHLLPGVLSTRMWIKQRNHACQTLLERWAEPFSALAGLHQPNPAGLQAGALAPFVHRAWCYLLENHPHDSICGCSVDQVHAEMATRFDWCEQLGEEVTHAALKDLAAEADTGAEGLAALVVFNSSSTPGTDRVVARVVPPVDPEGVQLVGPGGWPVPFRVVQHSYRSEMEMTFDRDTMAQVLDQALADGGVVWGEWRVRTLQVWTGEEGANVAVAVTRDSGPAGSGPLEEEAARLQVLLEDEAVRQYRVTVREDEALEVVFVARDVPPLGYATYRFVPLSAGSPGVGASGRPGSDSGHTIENEFLRVEADSQTGLLTVVDKETGWALRECNRFVDGGDRGDEYNYCRPERDRLIRGPARPPIVRRRACALGESLVVEMTYEVPDGLDPTDRSARGSETVRLPIGFIVRLTPGVRRVDLEASVDNSARDHRLRVHFPTSLAVGTASAAGHWDVVEWSLDLPSDTEEWVEQPVPTHPQRGWVSISDGQRGVTLANRGLPEVEVLRTDDGAEIALTLLRCVGWLSRGDLHCREGHAGPARAVPGAQCPGRWTFRYALMPHGGDWRAAFVEAESFQADMRAVPTHLHPGSLPDTLSFITVEPQALQVSAVKVPEEGDGLVVRLWNVEAEPVEGTVRLWRPFAAAVRTDMGERAEMERAATDGTDAVMLTVRGREVVTLRFVF